MATSSNNSTSAPPPAYTERAEPTINPTPSSQQNQQNQQQQQQHRCPDPSAHPCPDPSAHEPQSDLKATTTTTTIDPDPEPGTASPQPQPQSNDYHHLLRRVICTVTAIAMIALAAVSRHQIDRPRWLAPALVPGINSLVNNGVEMLTYLNGPIVPVPGYRSWDALSGIGSGVAGAFLLWMTMRDIRGQAAEATTATAGVGVSIVVVTFLNMFHHFMIHGALKKREKREKASK